MTSLEAGLILLPMSAVSAVIARPIAQRNLLRTPLVVAAVACLAGAAGVLFLTRSSPVAWIIVVTDVRVYRVDRLLGDHLPHLPHQRQRPRTALHRRHHDRCQRRGAAPHRR
jgi:hypothetical protein